MIREIAFAWLLCLTSASLLHPSRNLNTRVLKSYRHHSLASKAFGFKPAELFGVSRITNKKCSLLPITRTIVLGEEFEGNPEDAVVVDKSFAFFRLSLGWSADRIERSRRAAVEHFKSKFGLDLSSAVLNTTTGIYEEHGIFYAPFVFTNKLVKIADSDTLTPCTNVSAILGGWLLFGTDITYPMVPGVKGPVKVPGESALFFLYIVFQPGSKFSTAFVLKGTRPSACTFNVCQVVATTDLVDDYYGSSYPGNLEGIAVDTFVKPGVVKTFGSYVLTWPKRD